MGDRRALDQHQYHFSIPVFVILILIIIFDLYKKLCYNIYIIRKENYTDEQE